LTAPPACLCKAATCLTLLTAKLRTPTANDHLARSRKKGCVWWTARSLQQRSHAPRTQHSALRNASVTARHVPCWCLVKCNTASVNPPVTGSGPGDAQNDTAALLGILNRFEVGPQPLLCANPTGRPSYSSSIRDLAMHVLHSRVQSATVQAGQVVSPCVRAVSQTGGNLHKRLDWRGLSEPEQRGESLGRHKMRRRPRDVCPPEGAPVAAWMASVS
jgi:hypothetical protein